MGKCQARDRSVDERGPPRFERAVEGPLELLQRIDAVAVGSTGLGIRDVVRVLELDETIFAI
jgi:hypothetical protein